MANNAQDSSTLTPLNRFFKLLALERNDIYTLYVYALVSGIISILVPLGIQAIINFISTGMFMTSYTVLVILVVMATLAVGILKILQLRITERLQQRIFARAALDFGYRIPRFKPDAVKDEYVPELINRFFETIILQKGVPKVLVDFSASILDVILGLIIISFFHQTFLIMSLVMLLVIGLSIYFTAPLGLESAIKESKYKYKVMAWFEEIAGSPYDPDMALKETDNRVTDYLMARKKHFGILITQSSFAIFLKTLVTGLLLTVGGSLVLQGEINLGQFVASELIILLIIGGVEKIILTMETVYDVLTAIDKLGQITDIPLENYEKYDDEQ